MSEFMFLGEIDTPDRRELGGKGYSLGVLSRHGFQVPPGFVIPSKSFWGFVKDADAVERVKELISQITEKNIERISHELKAIVLGGQISSEMVSSVCSSLKILHSQYVAVRSSAPSEDNPQASFAGLHDSFLNVPSQVSIVADHVKKCWASLFNVRALAYRIRRSIPLLEGMAVIVQEMIPAAVSGTAFTAHPDTGSQEVLLIECSWGLGTSVVSGLVTPDLYVIEKKTMKLIEKTLGRKKTKTVLGTQGTIQIEASREEIDRVCLEEPTAQLLAGICLRIEELFGCPQDIEWCIQKDDISIVQSRPLPFATSSPNGHNKVVTEEPDRQGDSSG